METWERIADSVKLNTEINAAAWNAYINTLSPLSADNNTIVLEAPSILIKRTVEKRYIDIIIREAKSVTGMEYNVKLVDNNKNHVEPPALKIISTGSVTSSYRFDNFIVGSSNQLAYAASYAVAESPGTEYNPLFLYGDSGLGKTHLMNAIANFILEENPDSKIAYITCENFMNELVSSIRNKTNEKFRNKYRNLDVLLIDDIEFIKGKESTQDEFFYTFNALYENRRQIIMASDRPPKDIENLTDRLRSRFQAGLIADIQPPDFETRMAILQKKSEERGIEISDDVLQYIAKCVKSNIRELEGALNTVLAYKKLINRPIDLNAAANALKGSDFSSPKNELTIESIQNTVCQVCGISIEDLTGKKRSQPLSTIRQIAEYFCSVKIRNVTLSDIAAKFGGQNHTSVRTAVNKISGILTEGAEEDAKKTEYIKRTVGDIENRLSS